MIFNEKSSRSNGARELPTRNARIRGKSCRVSGRFHIAGRD